MPYLCCLRLSRTGSGKGQFSSRDNDNQGTTSFNGVNICRFDDNLAITLGSQFDGF